MKTFKELNDAKKQGIIPIFVVSLGKQVRFSNYAKGVKFAQSHPDQEFNEGLTCWWPCKGRDIARQFTESVHDRINQRAL